mgnify:CR=1 FL=1
MKSPPTVIAVGGLLVRVLSQHETERRNSLIIREFKEKEKLGNLL